MFDIVWVKAWQLSGYNSNTWKTLKRIDEFEKASRKTNIMISERG
jgi:hypothetical protein